MNKRFQGALAWMLVLAGSSTYAAETQFPSKSRTLTVPVPAQCRQWTPPKPIDRENVNYPSDARSQNGDAALLVRIAVDGAYKGVVDSLSSEESFLREAEASVEKWTFSPAICNGEPMEAQARVDFVFKREGAIAYKTGGFFQR